MEIGIIGLGVAGISVLKEIAEQTTEESRENMRITVFSEKEGFGTGFPYQPDDEALLINQYTETMSIDTDKSTDFLEWVKETKKITQLENTHLPRCFFGEYLLEKSRTLIKELNVAVVYDKVTAVKKQDNGQYKICTRQSTKNVDSIHLSAGHLAYQDPYDLKGYRNYIYNPYPAAQKLNFSKSPITVGIVGTGLTAVDTYLYMRKHSPNTRLTFLSLDGRFSSVRGHEPLNNTDYSCEDSLRSLLTKSDSQLSLSQIRKWFEQETEKVGIDLKWVWQNLGEGSIEGMQQDFDHLKELGEFQRLIHNLRDCYALLWNALSDSEKDHFLNVFGRKWSLFKAPVPQKTALRLIQDISEGNVGLLTGIEAVIKDNEMFNVQLNNGEIKSFDYIVNGTGQQMDLTRQLNLQQPLISDLVTSGLATPYKYGGILIDYPSMTVINQDGKRESGLKAYGQLVSGIQYGNSSVELVSKSAKSGVSDMLKNRG